MGDRKGRPYEALRGASSTFGSLGNRSARSPMMFFWICAGIPLKDMAIKPY